MGSLGMLLTDLWGAISSLTEMVFLQEILPVRIFPVRSLPGGDVALRGCRCYDLPPFEASMGETA